MVLQYAAGWLNLFHIETFTFASGYLFYMLRYEKGRYRTPKKDIQRRFCRLMVPFFAVSVFWALPAQLLAYGFSWEIIIKSFVLQIAPAQLWFLPMLFILYVVFYFLSDCLERIPVWAACAGYYVIYAAKLLSGKYIPWGVFQISNVIEYAIYFYLGCAFRSGKVKIQSGKQAEGTCLIALPVAAAYLWMGGVSSLSQLKEFIRPAVCAVRIFAVVCLGKMLSVERLTDERWFERLSRNAMGIYLFHQQILYITMRLFKEIPLGLQLLCNFAVALTVSYAISSLLRKVRWGRRVLGIQTTH